ncbi:MAG: glycosyltransferase [Pirellulales bacterium]
MAAPIYVEIFPLLLSKLTGIGRFSARLIEALNARVPLRLTSFVDPRTARVHDMPAQLTGGRELAVEAGELGEAGDDLTAWVRGLLRRPTQPYDGHLASRSSGLYTWARPAERRFGREVGVFYDFTPLVVPWSHTAGLCEGFHRQVASSRLCHKMVAISRSTRSDAAWLSPVADEDVIVSYPGPSQCLVRHCHRLPVERRENVILVVATREPRKNGDFLLDWFVESRELPRDAELWWAGPDGWLWKAPRGRAAAERFKRIQFLGMVSDERLCELYQQAGLSVYPSLYEGFGFPVLDSLMHGTPVLSSYNSSLAELDSPGVFYFDPCDAETLDAAYRELAAARPVAIDRQALSAAFSWDAMAQTVLSLM